MRATRRDTRTRTRRRTDAPVPWTVEYPHRNVAVVRYQIKNAATFHQWVLLRSDVHHDNPHSQRALEKRHLDEARERGAAIIDAGDLFCAMQGKYDKRSDKSCVRPEHQRGDYLDALIRTAADFYEPYAHNFVVIGDGNHETSIRDRHETDLNERLCQILRDRTGAKVQHSGYSGWVRFLFDQAGTTSDSVTLHYIHGYGGGGPVTLDMIQAQRRRAYIEGADVLYSGHTHDEWVAPTQKFGLSMRHTPYQKRVWSIKTTTYKDEFGDGMGGFHVQTGKPPKPVGAVWLEFKVRNNQVIVTPMSAQ